MPCTYTGTIEGDRAMFAEEAVTEVTSMLCRTLTLLEDHMKACQKVGVEHYLPKDIQIFWKEHKKLDSKRKKQEEEELKKSALAKLNDAERKVLGL